MINRFGGSTEYPYSVAQHCVFVSHRVEQKGGSWQQQLDALMHDTPEAFLMDIPRPTKAAFGEAYENLTVRFELAISKRFACGFGDPFVKQADNFALLVEARQLLPSQGRHWQARFDAWHVGDVPKRIVTPSYWQGAISWRTAKATFLNRFTDLMEAA
jgi:hypothetical protein